MRYRTGTHFIEKYAIFYIIVFKNTCVTKLSYLDLYSFIDDIRKLYLLMILVVTKLHIYQDQIRYMSTHLLNL